MRKLGVPYPNGYEAQTNADLKKQADEIASSIQTEFAQEQMKVDSKKEIIALIAYLQRLGSDIKNETK